MELINNRSKRKIFLRSWIWVYLKTDELHLFFIFYFFTLVQLIMHIQSNSEEKRMKRSIFTLKKCKLLHDLKKIKFVDFRRKKIVNQNTSKKLTFFFFLLKLFYWNYLYLSRNFWYFDKFYPYVRNKFGLFSLNKQFFTDIWLKIFL